MRRGLGPLLAALAVLTQAPVALADARVGLALSGRGAAAVQGAIERGLADRGLTVVITEPASEPAARARELDLSALVIGTVTPHRRRWHVDARVLDREGVERDRVQQRVARGRVAELVTRLARAVASLDGSAPPADMSESPSQDAPSTGTLTATSTSAITSTASSSSSATPSTRATAPRPEPSPGSTPAPVAALVQVGGGMRSRVIELVSPEGTDAAYRAEPYAELTVRAEVRFFDVAFVRGSFGSSVGLRSEREDPRLGEVDSWFAWMQADAGASVVLDGAVELGAAFGAGWDRYELTFNELVPTAEYVHLRPAALLAVRLVGRALVLHAEGAVRIPFGVGDLASVHGIEHDVIGADGLVRLGGTIDPGFTWAAELGVRRYWLTFTRPNGIVRGSDGGWHATLWAGWAF